jgi:uncharacterized protein
VTFWSASPTRALPLLCSTSGPERIAAMDWLAKLAVRAQAQASKLPSPCISVCEVSLSGGLCRGCLRTLDEIEAWATLSDADKRVVWARIEARAIQHGARP